MAVLSPALAGCGSTFPWVKEAMHPPSCVPDRPLTWDDFSERSADGIRAAATAVRFRLVSGSPAQFQVVLDPEESWVMPGLAGSWNPFMWGRSAHVLRHEQVHFAISCITTRQANAELTSGVDLRARLLLLQARAIRLNAQYDSETQHGGDMRKQEEWERRIRAQLLAGPLGPPIGR